MNARIEQKANPQRLPTLAQRLWAMSHDFRLERQLSVCSRADIDDNHAGFAEMRAAFNAVKAEGYTTLMDTVEAAFVAWQDPLIEAGTEPTERDRLDFARQAEGALYDCEAVCGVGPFEDVCFAEGFRRVLLASMMEEIAAKFAWMKASVIAAQKGKPAPPAKLFWQ